MTSIDQYLNNLDADESKEDSIKLLAEQLSCASSSAIAAVVRASNYGFKYKDVNNSTNGSEEFNNMFYEIAKTLINSVDGL